METRHKPAQTVVDAIQIDQEMVVGKLEKLARSMGYEMQLRHAKKGELIMVPVYGGWATVTFQGMYQNRTITMWPVMIPLKSTNKPRP